MERPMTNPTDKGRGEGCWETGRFDTQTAQQLW